MDYLHILLEFSRKIISVFFRVYGLSRYFMGLKIIHNPYESLSELFRYFFRLPHAILSCHIVSCHSVFPIFLIWTSHGQFALYFAGRFSVNYFGIFSCSQMWITFSFRGPHLIILYMSSDVSQWNKWACLWTTRQYSQSFVGRLTINYFDISHQILYGWWVQEV